MPEEARYLTATVRQRAPWKNLLELEICSRIYVKLDWRSPRSVNFFPFNARVIWFLHEANRRISPGGKFLQCSDPTYIRRIISGIIRREGTSIVHRSCKFLKRAIRERRNGAACYPTTEYNTSRTVRRFFVDVVSGHSTLHKFSSKPISSDCSLPKSRISLKRRYLISCYVNNSLVRNYCPINFVKNHLICIFQVTFGNIQFISRAQLFHLIS